MGPLSHSLRHNAQHPQLQSRFVLFTVSEVSVHGFPAMVRWKGMAEKCCLTQGGQEEGREWRNQGRRYILHIPSNLSPQTRPCILAAHSALKCITKFHSHLVNHDSITFRKANPMVHMAVGRILDLNHNNSLVSLGNIYEHRQEGK